MTVSNERLQEIVSQVEVDPKPEDPYASPASDLDAQVQQLGPGDQVKLAALLRTNPDQQQRILSIAVTQCGNATVQRALQLVANNEGAPSADGSAMAMEMFREENGPPAGSSFQPPSKAVQDDATEGVAEVAVMPAAQTGWEKAARHYNSLHQATVDEFNALTSDACLGPDGTVEPNLVRVWQGSHGVEQDGRVGPQTLAAAKKVEGTKSDEPAPAPTPAEDDNFDDIDGSAQDSRTYE
jgi:hypothetical protein